MKVNFTRIPNSILATLITRDITKRQTKIVQLVLRLTYGCQVPWALYEKRYFQVAGLHRGTIGQELKKLISMRVIEIDNEKKVIRVNSRVEEWRCSQNKNIAPNSVPELMREMISKQLRNIPFLKKLPDDRRDEIEDSVLHARSVKKLNKELLKKDELFLEKTKIYDQIDWSRMR